MAAGDRVARPGLAWWAGLLFIVAVAACASILELERKDNDDATSCTDRIATRSQPPKQARGGKRRPRLKGKVVAVTGANNVETDPELNFAFGASRNPLDQDQAFRVPKRVTRGEFQFGATTDLSDAESGHTINSDRLVGAVTPLKIDRRLIRLRVCLDPQEPTELRPGSYAGSVLVNAPQLRGAQAFALPVTVTVQDANKFLAMLFVLFGVAAGIVLRTYADLKQAPGQASGENPDLKTYLYSLRFLVMLAGGLLGGALGYARLYADDPAATTELFSSLLPLAGAGFAAALAAKSLADLSPPTARERVAGVAGTPMPPPATERDERE